MSIQFRDIETAPLPVKAKTVRAPRQPKYPLDGINTGGARAFPVGDGDPKKVKASVYQTAVKYRKDNPDFQFKVSIEKNEQTGATEIWVRRLATETSTPAAKSGNESVSNGAYDYSNGAAE